MKKYFIYEFKKSIFLIGVFTAIAVALSLVQYLSIRNEIAGITSISTILILGETLAFFLPFSIFKYKMKKRSIDLYYALPLSHQKIVIVKFLVGLTILFIPYTASYWLSFLIFAGMAEWVNAVYYIPMFFASIIPLYFIYSISAFLYTRANKSGDGFVFAAFWPTAIVLVLTIIARFFPTATNTGSIDSFASFDFVKLIYSTYIIPAYFSPSAPMSSVIGAFTLMAAGNYAPSTDPIIIGNMCAGFTFVTLCGVGSTVGLILLEKKAKAENTEQVSDSWFGYKVLIPLYGVCLASLSSGLGTASFILIILIFVVLFAISAAYRRTAKIGWIQLAILAGSIVAGLILYYIYFLCGR